MLSDSLYEIGALDNKFIELLMSRVKKSIILGRQLWCVKAYSLEDDIELHPDTEERSIENNYGKNEVTKSGRIPTPEGICYIIPSCSISTLPSNGLLILVPSTVTCLGLHVNAVLREAKDWLDNYMFKPIYQDSVALKNALDTATWIKIIGGENVEHLRATFSSLNTEVTSFPLDIDFRDFKSHKLRTMDSCFVDHTGYINLENLDMNNVESMRYTFAGYNIFNAVDPFNGINTKAVKDMTGIFSGLEFKFGDIGDELTSDANKRVSKSRPKPIYGYPRSGLFNHFDLSSVETLKCAFECAVCMDEELKLDINSQALTDISRILNSATFHTVQINSKVDSIRTLLHALNRLEASELNLVNFYIPMKQGGFTDMNIRQMMYDCDCSSVTLRKDDTQDSILIRKILEEQGYRFIWVQKHKDETGEHSKVIYRAPSALLKGTGFRDNRY